MKKIIVSFGTRPEIIKLAPVIQELKKNDFNVVVLHTGQHDELAEQMLALFGIAPDINLNMMSKTDDLFSLTASLFPELKNVFQSQNPDAVIVQGDTSSAYLSALAAFYLHIPVYHVEAGLRSFDMMNPFPEEMNRKQITGLTSHHFAPTKIAYNNLLQENINEHDITISGNTVIDALYQIRNHDSFKNSRPQILDSVSTNQKMILVTAHRRENHGEPLENIMEALVQIAEQFTNVVILFPAHPSPLVQSVVKKEKYSHDRIRILDPLGYLEFQHVMDRADLILSDSGGIQEEAAALGKNLLVLREATERQELVESGFTQLVGSATSKIISEAAELLKNGSTTKIENPYGDGKAAGKIVSKLKEIMEAELPSSVTHQR